MEEGMGEADVALVLNDDERMFKKKKNNNKNKRVVLDSSSSVGSGRRTAGNWVNSGHRGTG